MQSLTLHNNVSLLSEAITTTQIIPLSSASLLVVFGDTIEIAINEKVTALYLQLKQKKICWIKELTPAYASLGIAYDLYFIKSNFNVEGLVFDWVKSMINDCIEEITTIKTAESEIKEIPVCFDEIFQNDLNIMSNTLGLSSADIIDIFLSKTYYVFMLGFLPGFTYMGEVDNRIAIPRKITPVPTKTGAVGVAGNQTGIYPLDSLGGWHILGFTPINVFNPKVDHPNFFEVGNKVKFLQITEKEFVTMKNNTDN